MDASSFRRAPRRCAFALAKTNSAIAAMHHDFGEWRCPRHQAQSQEAPSIDSIRPSGDARWPGQLTAKPSNRPNSAPLTIGCATSPWRPSQPPSRHFARRRRRIWTARINANFLIVIVPADGTMAANWRKRRLRYVAAFGQLFEQAFCFRVFCDMGAPRLKDNRRLRELDVEPSTVTRV